MNGTANNNVYVSSNGQPMPDNFIFQTVDPSQDDDSDSDSTSAYCTQGRFQNLSGNPKPGKKTKGRVKIKMEFIENKLRRYTTFSKRKTGIMKKAYELSTLTGTQVMLLVASETGHVYTFATRKLQPMITSESGKALIQTCLNSPDPPPGTSSTNSLEQRMNPSGFEETELSCVTGEEEQRVAESGKPLFTGTHIVSVPQPQQQQLPSQNQEQASSLDQAIKAQRESNSLQMKQDPSLTSPAIITTPSSSTSSSSSSSKELAISSVSSNSTTTTTSSVSTMQIPFILSQGAISMLQTPNASVGQAISIPQISQAASTTVTNSLKPSSLSQVVTALKDQAISHSQTNSSGELNTPLPVSTPSINLMQNMTPGIVMYHTPQGIVYATPTQNLHERTIFNFSQPPLAISMTQADQLTGQQFITIPVPTGGTPMQLANPPAQNNADDTGQGKQPPTKKVKK